MSQAFRTIQTTLNMDDRNDDEHRLALVQQHYQSLGYRVHSGLQFGCEFVLYADDPSRVHSDFCVLVVAAGA